MKLLLDTHAFIWWVNDVAMAEPVMDLLRSGMPCVVSAATVWEIATKRALGKITFDEPIMTRIRAETFDLLPISGEHAEAAGALPRLHGDPFDRLLVAQAQIDGLTLVTRDPAIEKYDVARLRC